MPDTPNQQEAIVQEIIINLQNNGFSATAKNINSVKSLLSQLIAQDRNLAKSQNDLSKAVEKSTKLFTTMQSQVERSSKVVNKLSSIASNSLRSVTRMFADAFSGKVSSNGLQTLEKYNASLLKMSGLAKAFGGGMGNVQRSIEKLNRTTSLTKQSSSELFELYSNTMPTVSVGNFEKSMIRLSKATGGNVEIMKELIQTLGGLVEKYPALENAVVNLNSANAEYLKNNITLLQLTGKISLAEYKRYSSAIALAGGYATAEEKQIAKTQEVFSNLKKQSERLALGAGKIFLPFIEKIASFIEQNGERISAFMDKIAEMGKVLITALSPLANMLISMGESIGKFAVKHPVISSVIAGGALAKAALPSGTRLNPMWVKSADGGVGGIPGVGGVGGATLLKLGVIGASIGTIALSVKSLVDKYSAGSQAAEEAGITGMGAIDKMGAGSLVQGGWFHDKVLAKMGLARQSVASMLEEGKGQSDENRKRQAENNSRKAIEELNMFGGTNTGGNRSLSEINEDINKAKGGMKGYEQSSNYIAIKEGENELKRQQEFVESQGGESNVDPAVLKEIEKTEDAILRRKESLELEFPIAAKMRGLEAERAVAMNEQRSLSQSQTAVLQSQSGYLSTIVTQMNLTGKIDREKLHNEYIYTKELLQKEIEGKQIILENIQQRLRDTKQTKENEQLINEMKTEEIKLTGEIASKTEKLSEKQKDIFRSYDEQLKNLSLQSAQTKSLISLAQNYAIGVGASMNLQLKSFQASQKEIDMMNQKLSAINEEIASGAGNQLDLNNQRLELENQIYQKQLDQASTVKSLRDGWVSAVGAMNTGAGAFSKIVMSQEKNTGSMLSMLGNKAVLTSMSGAMGRGMGYGKSEKLTIGGQIAGAHKGLAYETQADKLMGGQGGVRALEMGQRDFLIKSMEKQTKQTMSKGGGALVFANEQTKSAAVEAGTMGYDASGLSASASGQNLNLPSVNVHIEVKDLDKLAQKISEKMGPALEQMASSIASKLTGGIR